jgi:RNA polymerase sigma-70 factor, ECF subfamily
MNNKNLTETSLENFNDLVLEYQSTVYNHVCWMLGDPDEAEDITQDVFITAYHRMDSCRSQSLRAWLLRIATNRCIDNLRRRKRRPTLPLEIEDEDGEAIESTWWIKDQRMSPEQQVEQSQAMSALHKHLHAMPLDVRTALIMVDVMEMNYEETAEALHIPVGTLKSRVSRGRSRLLQQMQTSERRTVRPAYQFSLT